MDTTPLFQKLGLRETGSLRVLVHRDAATGSLCSTHQDGLPTSQRSVRQLSGSAYLLSMRWLIEIFYWFVGPAPWSGSFPELRKI